MAYPRITLHNVMVEVATEKSIKLRALGKYNHEGKELTFWVPKSQTFSPYAQYAVSNIEVSSWFWGKIQMSLAKEGYPVDFAYPGSGMAPPPSTISEVLGPTVPALKQYKMLSLSTPNDAYEFVKFIADYFKDPMDLEKYLENQLQISNEVISLNLNINVKDLLLISLEEFKSELIQAALMHFFREKP